MKIERLKRFNKWKWIALLSITSVIVLVIVLKTTQAKYRFTASYQAAYGTIHVKSSDLEVLAVNLEQSDGTYTTSDTIPTSGYVLNETESYCGLSNGDGTYTKDDNITITYENGEVNINKITKKGTKCFLYFDGELPTINSVTNSSTTTSITVTANVSSDIGISKYYYQIESNSIIESTSNTYTFTGLSPGTSYTIKIYVIDTSGFKSSTYSKNISTIVLASDLILANNTIDTSRKSGEFTSVFTEDTAGKIFEGPADDYGDTTYFFAGANPNNWVKFAGFYWRIIRINGNGSLRLIYNGTSTTSTGTTTQISTSAFNSESQYFNKWVGYMYTSESVHGNGTSSTIKGVLDTWYQNNIASYSDKIDTDVGFCGDRQPSTTESSLNGSGGTGGATTYYAPRIRINTTKQFTYKCAESSDLYTISSSSYGNKALTYPIGLISADEVVFAGGLLSTNTSYWLFTGQDYWTISPCAFTQSHAYNYVVSSGYLVGKGVSGTTYGVRPSINITYNSISSGTGTSTDPYIVS